MKRNLILIMAMLLVFSKCDLCAQTSKEAANDLPYLVAILDKNDHQFICAGTIIDRQWILTSANPLVGQRLPSQIVVLAGEDNYFSVGSGAQLMEVEDYWYTEGYDVPMSVGNSAIIKLSTQLDYNDEVSPLNMMDVSYNQIRALAHYQYDDDMMRTFLEATEPSHQYAVGWDIYGNKTKIEVTTGNPLDKMVEEIIFDTAEEEPEDEENPEEFWFAEWAKDLSWSENQETRERINELLTTNGTSQSSPYSQPLYQATDESKNILTHGFTGGPLVSQNSDYSLPALSGVATWWTLNKLPEGILSTTLQGNPEAVGAIRRWYDLSAVLDPLVLSITQEDPLDFTYYTGLGNFPPSLFLFGETRIPEEVFNAEPIHLMQYEGREIFSAQSIENSYIQYKAGSKIKLQKGFTAKSTGATTQLLEANDNPLTSFFHAKIETAAPMLDMVSVMMGSITLGGSGYNSALGTMVLLQLFDNAWMPFIEDQSSPPATADPNEFPPISQLMDFSGLYGAPSFAISQGSNNGGGSDDSNGSDGSGDGSDGTAGGGSSGSGGGGSGGDDDDDKDDEKNDDVEYDPDDEDEDVLTFLHIWLNIDWEFVNANGGLTINPNADPTEILNRIPACNRLYLFIQVFNLRARFGPQWMQTHLNDEGVYYTYRQFIRYILRQLDGLAGQLIDLRDRNEIDDEHTPIEHQHPFDRLTLDILRHFYEVDPDFPLLGGGDFTRALNRIENERFTGFNTNGRHGLHARVLEVLIAWGTDAFENGNFIDGVDYFRFVNPNDRQNGLTGIPLQVARLIYNADYMVLDDLFNARNHTIDMIILIWNHIRALPTEVIQQLGLNNPQDNDYLYYNWRPTDLNDDNPVQHISDSDVDDLDVLNDRCSPAVVPNILPNYRCEYINTRTIDLEYFIVRGRRASLNSLIIMLDDIMESWGTVDEYGNHDPSSGHGDYERSFLELYDPNELNNYLFTNLVYAMIIQYWHAPEDQYDLQVHHILPLTENLIGNERYAFFLNMIEWAYQNIIPQYIRIFITFNDDPDSFPDDLPTLPLLDEIKSMVDNYVNAPNAIFLEDQIISLRFIEKCINWQNYFYNRLQLGLGIKESLGDDWHLMQILVVGTGRKCHYIDVDAELFNSDHNRYLTEIIDAVRQDYNRLGRFHTEWLSVTDPGHLVFNNPAYMLGNLYQYYDRFFGNHFSPFIRSEFTFNHYPLYFMPLDAYYFRGDIRNTRSLREIPYGFHLDGDLFLAKYYDLLNRIYNNDNAKEGPYAFDKLFDHSVSDSDKKKIFGILFWLRNNNLNDRSTLPINGNFINTSPLFNTWLIAFLNWMFNKYIPEHMDPNTMEPNGIFQGIQFGDNEDNLAMYIEARYVRVTRLLRYIDFERFRQRRLSGYSLPDAVGCENYNILGSMILDGQAHAPRPIIADTQLSIADAKDLSAILNAIREFFVQSERAPFETWYPVDPDEPLPYLPDCPDDEKKDPDARELAIRDSLEALPLNSSSMLLFPNPSNGHLSVNGLSDPAGFDITILTVGGEVISKFSHDHFAQHTREIKLELQYLPAGIYIMLIDTPEGNPERIKFRIER